MKKNILFTGANGFLGRNFQDFVKNNKLSEKYNFLFPSSKQFNCLDMDNMRIFLESKKIDIIIHAAAICGGILANKNSPAQFLRDNTQMSINIYECAREYMIDKVYSLGTVCSYPMNCPIPFNEKDIWNGQPEITNMPYGVAKRTLLMLSQTYRQQYNIGGAHLIPANMYGKCFSADTLVATPTGFKNIKDFKSGDLVYGLNPQTHNVEIEKVTHTQVTTTNEFINFSGSIIDFKVTPEHKIYYKTNTNFQKKEASYFIERAGKSHGQIRFASNNALVSQVEYSDEIDLSEYIDSGHEIKNGMVRDHKHSHSHWIPIKYKTKDFFEFLGFYMSEGSQANGTNQISISQNQNVNKYTCAQIENLLKRMNLPIQNDSERFYFSSRLWCNFIKKNNIGYSDEKHIPQKFLHAPLELLETIFFSMMMGDGNKSFSRYSTKSCKLKDQIILLSMVLGIQIGKIYQERGCWRITFRKFKKPAVKYKNISYEVLNEPEKVYCITTEKNHIIYAGRNNKFGWIGQCDHFDLINSHVIPALINKFTTAKKENLEEVKCWGTGGKDASREFLFAEDCCAAIMQAVILEVDEHEPINIGNGKEIYISDLANQIAQLINYKGKITFTGEVSNGQPRRCLNVSRAKKILQWKAKTNLKSGLIKTIEWYSAKS